jgi:hypothetical protein
MKYEIRKLSFGETLNQAFKLYYDNFGPLFLLALISSIPAVLFPLPTVPLETAGPAEQQAFIYDTFLLGIVFIVVNTIATALMIEYISKRYLNIEQSMSQYLKNVIPFFVPVIGLSVIEGLLVGIGFLAFFIPGVYFLLALRLSSQVLIIERKKVFESIKRSFALTQGYILEILGYLLALFMITVGVLVIGDLFTGLFVEMQLPTQGIRLFNHVLQVLITPVGACLFILVYFNIRIEREGFHLGLLAGQVEPVEHSESGDSEEDVSKE